MGLIDRLKAMFTKPVPAEDPKSEGASLQSQAATVMSPTL